jgi:hypothetical protein
MKTKLMLTWSLLLLIAFALSGQHLAHVVVLRFEQDNLQRMMARANHIYLLLAGLLNVAAALVETPAGWRGKAVGAGQALVTLSGAVFAVAYMKEFDASFAARSLALPGCVLSAAGTLLLLAKTLPARRV